MGFRNAYLFVLLFAWGCKEPFEPDLSMENLGVLTVEGYSDTDGTQSQLYLGYTRLIYGENLGPGSSPAIGARVLLESNSGMQYPLQDMGNGNYLFEQDISEDEIYRLRVFLDEDDSYTSEPMLPMISNPIEDIGFEKDERGVEIYITTRGSQDVDDFIWTFEETYEFNPIFISPWVYRPETKEIGSRSPEENNFLCYRNLKSGDLLMEISSNFDENVIFKKAITRIEPGDERLSVRYSILVSQMALSQEAAEFWEIMKKNRDDIGTIFSPMPSNISGNMSHDQDPEVSVIGHVSLGVVEQRRLFISAQEVNPWYNSLLAYYDCILESDTVPKDRYEEVFASGIKLPTVGIYLGDSSEPIGFRAALRRCVDCTLRGTNVKPDFW